MSGAVLNYGHPSVGLLVRRSANSDREVQRSREGRVRDIIKVHHNKFE